jgi:hypothetical protein
MKEEPAIKIKFNINKKKVFIKILAFLTLLYGIYAFYQIQSNSVSQNFGIGSILIIIASFFVIFIEFIFPLKRYRNYLFYKSKEEYPIEFVNVIYIIGIIVIFVGMLMTML